MIFCVTYYILIFIESNTTAQKYPPPNSNSISVCGNITFKDKPAQD